MMQLELTTQSEKHSIFAILAVINLELCEKGPWTSSLAWPRNNSACGIPEVDWWVNLLLMLCKFKCLQLKWCKASGRDLWLLSNTELDLLLIRQTTTQEHEHQVVKYLPAENKCNYPQRNPKYLPGMFNTCFWGFSFLIPASNAKWLSGPKMINV